MTTFPNLADALADRVERERIERPKPITTPVARLSRQDLWPAEEWARMQKIANGEIA